MDELIRKYKEEFEKQGEKYNKNNESFFAGVQSMCERIVVDLKEYKKKINLYRVAVGKTEKYIIGTSLKDALKNTQKKYEGSPVKGIWQIQDNVG